MGVELGDHVGGERSPRVLLDGPVTAVVAAEAERRSEVREQAHLPGLSDHERAVHDDAGRPALGVGVAGRRAQRSSDADQEAVDVGAR